MDFMEVSKKRVTVRKFSQERLDYLVEIDVLINNAGFGDSGSFAESDWQK